MKKYLVTSGVVLGLVSAPAPAADVSANGGLMSEYIFRGIPQSDGNASAFAGLDIEQSGFFVGTWAASVDDGDSSTDDGLEVDLYGGYGFDVGEISLGIGATGYFYTDDFDDTYKELNLSAGWGPFSLDAALGRYENFDGPTQDYQFYSFSGEYRGFYGKVGMFADDFDGEYYEAGYGNTLSVNEVDLFDYTLSVIYSTEDLLGDDDDTSLVLTVGRTFSLFTN